MFTHPNNEAPEATAPECPGTPLQTVESFQVVSSLESLDLSDFGVELPKSDEVGDPAAHEKPRGQRGSQGLAPL
jgi:hypothetical protein